MKIEKLTQKLREALESAVSIAQEKQHQQVEPEHLDLALLRQDDSVLVHTLDELGVSSFNVIKAVEAAVDNFTQVSGKHTQAYLSSRTNKLFSR